MTHALAWDPGTEKILAGTYGGSIYESTIDVTLISVEHKAPPAAAALELGNYPNPFSGQTTISYSLPQAGRVHIEINNVLGERVAALHNREAPAGQSSFTFNATGLASGIY